MRYLSFLLLLIAVSSTLTTHSQNGLVLKDTGLQKLSVFIGTWEARNAPGSKDSTTAVYGCRWSDNGHFLVCDQLVQTRGRQTNNLSIYSYDGIRDSYTLSLVGVPGVAPFSIPIKSKGDTLIYSGKYSDQGKTVYTRTLNIFNTTASYRFIVQSSTDSLAWKTLVEGVSIKTCLGQNESTSVPAGRESAIQRSYGLDPHSTLVSRVRETPPDVLKQFYDAGMSPHEHILTDSERLEVAAIFAALPPLHQRVLKAHLRSISFLDDMPNTALTSAINGKDTFGLYHITLRAAILHQNITEWLTEKERTCFAGDDQQLSVSVEGGGREALLYVLLHESTHVVDGSLGILPKSSQQGQPSRNSFPTKFTRGIWIDRTALALPISDSLLLKNRFRRGGGLLPISLARRVYGSLEQTPFVSLYSTSSWHEDLAEFLTVYHLTHQLKQPFRIVVSRNGVKVFAYEPMKSGLVQRRSRLMRLFYRQEDAEM